MEQILEQVPSTEFIRTFTEGGLVLNLNRGIARLEFHCLGEADCVFHRFLRELIF